MIGAVDVAYRQSAQNLSFEERDWDLYDSGPLLVGNRLYDAEWYAPRRLMKKGWLVLHNKSRIQSSAGTQKVVARMESGECKRWVL